MSPKDLDEHFRSVLHGYLQKHRGVQATLAEPLDMRTDNFDSRVYGRVKFSVGEAMAVLRQLKAVEIADAMIGHAGFFASRSETRGHAPAAQQVPIQAGQAVITVADILEEVHRSLANDGTIDKTERAAIAERIKEAERAMAGLKKLLEIK